MPAFDNWCRGMNQEERLFLLKAELARSLGVDPRSKEVKAIEPSAYLIGPETAEWHYLQQLWPSPLKHVRRRSKHAMEPPATRRCGSCEVEKPFNSDHYPLDHARKFGLSTRCRECHRSTSLAWKLSDRGREAGRRYANSERGRIRHRLQRQAKKQSNNV
jgi:hypothetical protein